MSHEHDPVAVLLWMADQVTRNTYDESLRVTKPQARALAKAFGRRAQTSGDPHTTRVYKALADMYESPEMWAPE